MGKGQSGKEDSQSLVRFPNTPIFRIRLRAARAGRSKRLKNSNNRGQKPMTETKVSRRSYEELTEAAKQEGTTPEAILDKALEQFLAKNQ